MSGTVSFNPHSNLMSRQHYHSQFTDEETEAQRMKSLALSHTASLQQECLDVNFII